MSARQTQATALAIALAALTAGPACSVLQEAPGEQGEDWVEAPVAVPAYPVASGLIAVDLGRPGDAYRYQIDPASLSLGSDGVTRYTVVLIAGGGGKNVLFEGIRCQTLSAKRYAYGVAGAFEAAQSSDWEAIRQDGPRAYQSVLARGYLCQRRGLPYDAALAVDRLRRGGAPGIREADMGIFR